MATQGGISGSGLAAATAGSILLWSAIKGKAWTGVLRDLIKGTQPSDTQDYPITATSTGTNSGSPGITPGPAGGTAAQNQAIAKALMPSYGWSDAANWDALVKLWDGESNWSNTADNPSSHAYGIPQALPFNKMPKEAWPPSAGGSSNASAQIQWGLSYIKGRYGSPSAAYSQWLARDPHWY